jgi:hypothetical protein
MMKQKSVVLITCLLVLFTFGLSLGSAVTISLAPADDTYINEGNVNGSYGSNSQLRVGNDGGDTKRSLVLFDLSSIPTNATITSATLYMYNYNQVGSSRVHAAHRLLEEWNESGATWNNAPSYSGIQSATAITTTGENYWMEWDLADDVEDFYDGSETNYGWLFRDTEEAGSRRVDYDSDEDTEGNKPYLEVEYFVIEDPICNIDYLGDGSGNINYFNISDYYFNQVGDFRVWGSAGANSPACNLQFVSYNRTSLGSVVRWTENADNQGGWEDWASNQNDPSFEEGLHQICCIVESETCEGGCQTFTNETCEEFCIDATEPVMDGINDNTVDCSEDGRYWADDVVTWNWSAHDIGCAGMKEYEVALYFSNGSMITKFFTNDTYYMASGLEDGEDYYVEVWPVDNANNMGESIVSEHVIIDLTDPVITFGIIHPLVFADSTYWATEGFWVPENDTDVNLLEDSCRIRVDDDGINTVNESVVCNTEHYVVNESCMTDGYATCEIWKSAMDKACRVGDAYTSLHVDKHAPNTTKMVSNPKFAPWGLWVSWLTNGWFVTNETEFSLVCYDNVTGNEGSGCNNSYYNVTNADNGDTVVGTTIYDSPFSLPNVDGNYTITYWSDDKVGHVEDLKWEVDKLDNIAPETTKTYDLFLYGWRYMPVFNDLLVWMRFIRPDTNITLSAYDSEVGVDTTYYQILVPAGEGDHTEYYCFNDSTSNNGTWYEEGQDGMNCTETAWNEMNAWDYCDTQIVGQFEYPYVAQGLWCIYEHPVQVNESDHKICYFTGDKLDNVEDIKCQVFSVDGLAPEVFVVNPHGETEETVEYCSIPLDIEIKDMKAGLNDSTVYAMVRNSSGNEVSGPHELVRDPDYDGDGFNVGGDKFYLPNNLDLDGLPAGWYTIEIYANDLLGNGGNVENQSIQLQEGIYARLSEGCSIGKNGGFCTLEYTACVRNGSLMGFNMTKIYPKDGGDPVASLSDLDATFHTEGGSGAVQQINFETGVPEGFTGDIVPFTNDSCEVINGRIKFNVTLNFTEGLVDLIGGGDYQFDWAAETFLDDSCTPEEPYFP